MNPRTKNLAIAGAAVVVVGFVAVDTLVPAPPAVIADTTADGDPSTSGGTPPAVEPGSARPAGEDLTPVVPPGASPAATLGSPASSAGATAEAEQSRRDYAIGLHDLAGLPPDAAAGTRLELWVTWEPPVTRAPRLQKLVGDVVVERTIPGAVPEAPVTVVLSVPADRVGDLIYADGYGKLSVVLPG